MQIMDAIKEINQKTNKVFELETAYSISKNSGLPRQTVTDLMTGKSDIKKQNSLQ